MFGVFVVVLDFLPTLKNETPRIITMLRYRLIDHVDGSRKRRWYILGGIFTVDGPYPTKKLAEVALERIKKGLPAEADDHIADAGKTG